jgi:hypothetical protein
MISAGEKNRKKFPACSFELRVVGSASIESTRKKMMSAKLRILGIQFRSLSRSVIEAVITANLS